MLNLLHFQSMKPKQLQSTQFDDIVVFTPGKEYIYKYESQILSGIPHLANQYSGLKIKADVKLQIGSGNRAMLLVF